MKNEHHGMMLALVTIVCLLMLAPFSLAAKIKIKVAVENATIRSGPSLGSEVIQEDVPLGTTFDTEQITGDWYEVRFRNSLGVMVSGYIHKMYVEVVQETPAARREVKKQAEPEMEPEVPLQPQRRRESKGDFAIMGGLAMGSFLSESSSYSSSWSEGILKSVTESGTITHQIDNPLGFGVSLSYLFLGALGIQARVDYNFTKQFKPEESFSTYNITWSWTSSGPFSREESWNATGEILLIPLSLNLILKTRGGGFILPYISGGVTYFTGKISANTYVGYGLTWTDNTTRYIDYLSIPVEIDESLSHIGFNVGGGLDFLFGANVAVCVEGNYFMGKTFDEYWNPVPGTYPGNNFPDVSWVVDQVAADSIAEEITPLKIKTSFLKLQAGIKFLF
jgi:opacity protein-like surface antigen